MCATHPSPLPIRLLTYNIRYATTAPFPGEAPWADRLPRVHAALAFATRHCAASIICLQEALHSQLLDILSALNGGAEDGEGGEWGYVGVGRDDGKQAGEYVPILFRKAAWRVDGFKTWWLSETPSKPSKGWDAATVRVLSVAQLVHRPSGRAIGALNTHLDDQGAVARREGAKLVRQVVWRDVTLPNIPLFVAGDLNSEAGGEAYEILKTFLSDAREEARRRGGPAWGERNTYTGFGREGEPHQRLDFVFVGPRPERDEEQERWRVEGYSVLPGGFEDDGVLASDHRAVVVDALLL
ncbi:MAG: hypothetical protein M1832_003577 [Thelocarpon impressellum]|nr:MAG: hypothetical protein M1832_003577 [Thelocarpon impressellum]